MTSQHFRISFTFYNPAGPPIEVRMFCAANSAGHAVAMTRAEAADAAGLDPAEVEYIFAVVLVPGVRANRRPERKNGQRWARE